MWTALSLWFATIAGVTAYAVWAQDAIARGAPGWLMILGAVGVYLALIATFMSIYFAIAWWFRSPRPREMRLGPAATLRLVANEYRALTGAARRMMFYKLLVRDPPGAPAALPVLLLHGVLCNAGVWDRFSRGLRKHGVHPVYTMSYGPPLASIETFADQLALRIETILAQTGARDLVIVSHSMGGLVALAYCRKHGAARIRRLISLATPYYGSVHAWCFPGVCLSQLRPGSAWLALLHRTPFARPPVTSIWSWHDSMVAPQLSSRMPGADNIELVGVGHNAILADAGALALVIAAIAAARPATSESPA
jgi:pimeloyl-ACP methyl ester carboxylesterase